MSIDVTTLWNFSDPAGSQARFEAAREGASPEDDAILLTQIARTFGLRKDFDRARAVLGFVDPSISPEVAARYHLELGRTYASLAHPKEERDNIRGREHYEAAFAAADAAGLGGLATDALHMLAIVESDPELQLTADLKALEYALSSSDSEAKKWEASLRNNIGCGLHDLGRYPEALDQFKRAVECRRAQGGGMNERIARWMVAWTLRHLDRDEEALVMQLAIKSEFDAEGGEDKYVLEELSILYDKLGQPEEAAIYRAK